MTKDKQEKIFFKIEELWQTYKDALLLDQDALSVEVARMHFYIGAGMILNRVGVLSTKVDQVIFLSKISELLNEADSVISNANSNLEDLVNTANDNANFEEIIKQEKEGESDDIK